MMLCLSLGACLYKHVSKPNAHLAASSSGTGALHAGLVYLFRLQMEWFKAEHTGSYRSCPSENGAQFADSQSASAFSSALNPIF